MTLVEIELAQGYLARSDQDPVAALIRSVRDLAKLRRLLAAPEEALGLPSARRSGHDRSSRPGVPGREETGWSSKASS